MDAPRIRPLEPPYDEELATTLRRLMGGVDAEPLALFRTIAHHPQLLERFRSMGTLLLNYGDVAPRERELVILRTTARCEAWYEWSVHVEVFAAQVGLDDAAVHATTVVPLTPEGLSVEDRLILELSDALHDSAAVPDRIWTALAASHSPAQLLELLALAGQYRGVSYYVNAIGIEPEPWAPVPAVARVAP
ncbi:carboxymuconolactone decarboxylase family protein [Nocardioides speluncae]|uniref:carboxymuconolactone decarboxylase family protein n=1 Tax=Nocardioides speluncae TaxID=2670337 RepID=UPI000D695FBB|nr:carboxymuconolactone decarboxylase family protein [Nocardioides speluncae]